MYFSTGYNPLEEENWDAQMQGVRFDSRLQRIDWVDIGTLCAEGGVVLEMIIRTRSRVVGCTGLI